MITDDDDDLLKYRLETAITKSRITRSQAFSPIPNPGIGSIPMLELQKFVKNALLFEC